MIKNRKNEMRDIEKCREGILALLREYNCTLMDPDEGSHVLLYDNDTRETIHALRSAYSTDIGASLSDVGLEGDVDTKEQHDKRRV